jgi:chaperone BCS1
MFNPDIITIYNTNEEKERKRENFIIYLRTYIDDYATTDIIDDFCRFCVSEFVKSQTSIIWEQKIFTNKNSSWDTQLSGNQRVISTVVLKDGFREKIYSDLKLFLRSELWYKTRGIPYSRGYLFFGLPGTGKTSMIKALSNECKRHIHFLNLGLVEDDKQLIDLLKQIKYDETILVIEDIDCVSDAITNRNKIEKYEKESEHKEYDDKKNVVVVIQQDRHEQQIKHTTKLTLSGILNSLDGVFNNDGRILIITTNHPEILDDALIRPGRVDIKIPFMNCDIEQIKNLYEIFFEQKCPIEIIKSINPEKYSPADIISNFLCNRDNPENALHSLIK